MSIPNFENASDPSQEGDHEHDAGLEESSESSCLSNFKAEAPDEMYDSDSCATG